MTGLDVKDYTILGLYFLFIIIIALLSTFIKRSRKTTEGYFLAGKTVSWWGVGASLFASNIGSFHFIGLAGSGAAVGVAVISYEWSAVWLLLLLGWYYVPVYLKANIFTLPEYIEKRFNSKVLRIYFSILALFLYCFTKISVDLYSGAIVLESTFEINFYISTLILLVVTGAYTIFGGLAAVIYTEVIQTLLMLVGALILSVISLVRVGGISGLYQKFPTTFNNSFHNRTFNTCFDPSESFHIFRPLSDPQFPWLGLIFGLPISGVWYWCTDQVEVQRVLSAKDKQHAQGGTILAGFLKLTILLLIVFPGMVARVLFTEEVACKDCSNKAYILLILNLMPSPLRGLMVAVVLAALMSSLASTFNSSSTLITIDVWKFIRPKAGNKELIIVGQVVVVFVIIVSVAWLPVIQVEQNGQLFVYIQIISAYLTPSIAATFTIGISWKRANKWGAMVGSFFGLLLGAIKLILDLVYGVPDTLACERDTRPAFVNINYLYFAIILLFVSAIPNIVVSLLTPRVDIKDLHNYVINWRDIIPYNEILTKRKSVSDQVRNESSDLNRENCHARYSKSSSFKSDQIENSVRKDAEHPSHHIDTKIEDTSVENNDIPSDNEVVMNEDTITLIPTITPIQARSINRTGIFRDWIIKQFDTINVFDKLELITVRKLGLKTVCLFKVGLLYTFAFILVVCCSTLYALYI